MSFKAFKELLFEGNSVTFQDIKRALIKNKKEPIIVDLSNKHRSCAISNIDDVDKKTGDIICTDEDGKEIDINIKDIVRIEKI